MIPGYRSSKCLYSFTLSFGQGVNLKKRRNQSKVVDFLSLVPLQAKDTEVRGTKFVVPGLKEGGLYRFRVRAVNVAGVGDPGLVAELIEVKDRTSKTLIHQCTSQGMFLMRKLLFY